MKDILKKAIQEDMEKFPFVMWDRFVKTKNGVEVFGWIKREDSHEDFVSFRYRDIVIDYDKISWNMEYSTSSAEHTKKMFYVFECEGEHGDCQRVEDNFQIANVIKLENEKRK